MKEVIDSRFLIELFSSAEPQVKKKAANKIHDLQAKGEGIIPTIVIAEIVKFACEKFGKAMAESNYEALYQSNLKIQDLTPEIAKTAGLMKSKQKTSLLATASVLPLRLKYRACPL